MAYPGNHGYLSFSGSAYGTLEEWATGLRLEPSIPPTVAQLTAAGDAFVVLCGTTALGTSNAARMVTTKWAPQDAEGLYGGGQAIEHLRTPQALGSNSYMPAQISVVLSLRTARPRGIGSNGRMYIPALPEMESNTGRFGAGTQTTIQEAAAAFIGAINGIGIGTVVVASRGRTVDGVVVSPGVFEPVTGVRVGRVPDTQRRRRHGLDEGWVAASPVPS